MFFWNKNFELGIAELDDQHKRLLQLINELELAFHEGCETEHTEGLISQLVQYAVSHFRDEERLIAQNQLSPQLEQLQQGQHQQFVQYVAHLISTQQHRSSEGASQLLRFLNHWLITHILGNDRQIAVELGMIEHRPQVDHAGTVAESILLDALNESELRFRFLTDNTPVMIWMAGASGDRTYSNNTYLAYVDSQDTHPAHWQAQIHPDDFVTYLPYYENLICNPQNGEFELRLKRHDGVYHWFLENIVPRFDDSDRFVGLIGSLVDITSLKQAEEALSRSNQRLEQEVARRTRELEELLLTDPLTGVGNRRFLVERLRAEVAKSRRHHQPLSVVFTDLDHFKQINDRYGHSGGDEVLCHVAELLKDSLRNEDMIGRFGGEEFVMLLTATPLEQALLVAERIRVSLGTTPTSLEACTVTASFGVAELNPGESAEELLNRSDRALYAAKEAGRNCVMSAESSA